MLLLAAALLMGDLSKSWIGIANEQLQSELSELHMHEPNYVQRLMKISQRFVGAPYVFSPLGEASGQDNDPLFTTKAFDCLSLVEISMALASTPDMPQAMKNLVHIRYTGDTVIYTERKHFMESQWIPENIRMGWVKDITQEVAPEAVVQVQKAMSPAIYAKRKKTLGIDLPDQNIPQGTFKWWAIPLDKMASVAHRIPTGAVIFVVRHDYSNIPFRISHVGFVMQRKSGTWVRHAKDSGAHMVIDAPIEAVIKRHAEFVKWPVTGFSVYMPQQPPLN